LWETIDHNTVDRAKISRGQQPVNAGHIEPAAEIIIDARNGKCWFRHITCCAWVARATINRRDIYRKYIEVVGVFFKRRYFEQVARKILDIGSESGQLGRLETIAEKNQVDKFGGVSVIPYRVNGKYLRVGNGGVYLREQANECQGSKKAAAGIFHDYRFCLLFLFKN